MSERLTTQMRFTKRIKDSLRLLLNAGKAVMHKHRPLIPRSALLLQSFRQFEMPMSCIQMPITALLAKVVASASLNRKLGIGESERQRQGGLVKSEKGSVRRLFGWLAVFRAAPFERKKTPVCGLLFDRVLIRVVALAGVGLLATTVHASNLLWSSAGGSAWLTAVNWTGGSVPSASDNAQFGANPTSGST